jgi:hypothetical protein
VLHLQSLVLLLVLAQPLQLGHHRRLRRWRSPLEHAIAHLLALLAQHEGVDTQRLGDVLDEHTTLVTHLNRLQLELNAVAIDLLWSWASHCSLPSLGESVNDTGASSGSGAAKG